MENPEINNVEEPVRAGGFCPHCGQPIAAGVKFCTHCGKPIEDEGPTAVEQVPELVLAAAPEEMPVQTSAAEEERSPEAQEAPAGGARLSVRTASILSYLFGFIGWAIGYFLGDNKDEFLRFHLNQALVLAICELVAWLLRKVPVVGFVLDLALLALWVIAIMGAIRGEKKKIPLLGDIQLMK